MSPRREVEPRGMREPPGEIEVPPALKPQPCGRDGPLEKGELMGVGGQTEQPVSWTEDYHNPPFGVFFRVLQGMARHKISSDGDGDSG